MPTINSRGNETSSSTLIDQLNVNQLAAPIELLRMSKNNPKEHYKQLDFGYIFRGKSGKDYKIVKRIGEGGMGAVYEVEDTATHKRYAVKTEKLRDNGQRLAMEVSESCTFW